MSEPTIRLSGTGAILRCLAYCTAFTILVGVLCTAVIRLLPRLGGWLTHDEIALQYLESLGRAEVSPAWQVPIIFSLLLLIGLFLWKLRIHKRQFVPKRMIPLFFSLSLWLGFIPVLIMTLIYTQVNTIPVKVVLVFITMFLG